ncbi:hypothetical protein Skr01_56890 [Sphaerisporangium krabiense]|uniref:Uncharacterized protein n=1 Tax=Sphaerisporangium krabiense TaxID=763782 RepID=A0A7W9DSC1_9ACTN|nr:hypothetical protein [Sphaerisporangium krabiense]MBB5629542.1 hypothetical protein [Sphaerisporangium krabiense]GII65604.1 hypothetical protein Skr01_56890 [Sphaerisporangium krabiense]
MGFNAITARQAAGTRPGSRRATALVMMVLTVVTAMVTTAPAARADLPYGPYTCRNGSVWREAVPADRVCVDPARRAQTWQQNAEAASHVEPGGGPYGPDTCKQGYVWRESRPSDHVCVTPSFRDTVEFENKVAPVRYADLAAIPANTFRFYRDPYGVYEGASVQGYSPTPGGYVAMYGWLGGDSSGDVNYIRRIGPGQNPLAWGWADSTGFLRVRVTPPHCIGLNSNKRMYLIVVDEATGSVSNAGWGYVPCGWV